MKPRTALLDVNVLIALLQPEHVHHDLAHDWFRTDGQKWATCPFTENGLVRILSNPRLESRGYTVEQLLDSLRRFRASRGHEFWPADISICDQKLFKHPLPSGHKQLTDVYLLGLARRHNGSLVTLDQTIPLGAVHGATKAHLQVIRADTE